MDIISQWNEYCELWESLTPLQRAQPLIDFWKDPAITGRFVSTPKGCDELKRVALYWGSFSLGNVVLERAFGQMRAMEGPQRYSLSADSVRLELMAKFNAPLIEKMLDKCAKQQLIRRR